ncbi:hypothetical protein HMPREF9601_00739 [Cutibacterium acnes HL030PA1]|nr:hypothetical protein HMPREF9601_00739 [Cutibacterium acnes HL030PA1]
MSRPRRTAMGVGTRRESNWYSECPEGKTSGLRMGSPPKRAST